MLLWVLWLFLILGLAVSSIWIEVKRKLPPPLQWNARMKDEQRSVRLILPICVYGAVKWNAHGGLTRRFRSYLTQLELLHGRLKPLALELQISWWLSLGIYIGVVLMGFYLLTKEATFIAAFLLFMVLLPFWIKKRTSAAIEQRKQLILLELPDFVSRLVLLINAGETLQNALKRCTEQEEASIEPLTSPFRYECFRLRQDMEHQKPLPAVLEDFNRRCRVPEVSVFVTTILMNYRKGGEDLSLSLRELSRDLWEKRKAQAKTLGEQASSKLIFPMLLIFIAIMVIVAAPAMMLMNE